MRRDKRALFFAVANYPAAIEVRALREAITETRRGKGDRPPDFRVQATDKMIRALRGAPVDSPMVLFLVAVPTSVAARSLSRIVLPGEGRAA